MASELLCAQAKQMCVLIVLGSLGIGEGSSLTRDAWSKSVTCLLS